MASPHARRRLLILLGLALTCVVVMAGSVFFGAVQLSSVGEEQAALILFKLRLPRILLAALVGAALATAGASLQALFRNPMADPYLLGVSAGGGLGAAIGIAYEDTLGGVAVPALAGATALATVWVVYMVAKAGGQVQPATLLLTGIAVSTLLMSIMSFVVMSASNNQAVFFMRMYGWMLGGFDGTVGMNNPVLSAPYIGLCVVVLLACAHSLNAMLLGEETAHSVGVDVKAIRRTILIASSLLSAAAVCVAGIIGFVGLIVPHAIRLLLGPDHRWLIPGCLFAGAAFLVICDTMARSAQPPMEFPVGIFSALFGVPFFLYLLRKSKRVYL